MTLRPLSRGEGKNSVFMAGWRSFRTTPETEADARTITARNAESCVRCGASVRGRLEKPRHGVKRSGRHALRTGTASDRTHGRRDRFAAHVLPDADAAARRGRRAQKRLAASEIFTYKSSSNQAVRNGVDTALRAWKGFRGLPDGSTPVMACKSLLMGSLDKGQSSCLF